MAMRLFSGWQSAEEFRRTTLANIMQAAKANDTLAVTQNVVSLYAGGHMDAPEIPFALTAALEALAQQDGIAALSAAVSMLQIAANGGVRELLTEKTFSLMQRIDHSRVSNLFSIETAASAIVSVSPPGSTLEKRGMAAWLSTVEEMASKSNGLSFAFTAAGLAAISTRGETLRELGRKTWQKLIEDVAKTDPVMAEKEAQRAVTGYEAYGSAALPLRAQAMETLKKIAGQQKPKAP